MKLCEDSILDLLDSCYQYSEFPSMYTTGPWAYVRVRLFAFRKEDAWLITFQQVVYSIGGDDFGIVIFGYGNAITKCGVDPVGPNGEKCSDLTLTGIRVPPPPSHRIGEDYDGWWCQDPYDVIIQLNATFRHLELSPEDYNAARIDVAQRISGGATLDRIVHVGRTIAYKLPVDDLFYSSDGILNMIGLPNMENVRQLDEWCHPDGWRVKLPSSSPSLCSIARLLCGHTLSATPLSHQMVNTHWYCWPLFGRR